MPGRSKHILIYDSEKYKNVNEETIRLFKKYRIDMTLRELSPKTVSSYESDLKAWSVWVYDNQANRSVLELSEDDLTEFFYFCKVGGNNSNRMNRRMASISAFYRFLRKKRLITENPAEFLDRPRNSVPIAVQTFLTKPQVDELRKKLEDSGNLQLHVYVMLSLSTMARVSAIASIRWDMIDFEQRIIQGVTEKEGKVVDLFFSKEVKELLLRLQAYRKEHDLDDLGWVFRTNRGDPDKAINTGTLSEWAHLAGSLIGVDTLHPHDFRHSGATLLKNAGMALEDVSALLNHESTDTTRKFYIKEDVGRISQLKDRFDF